LVSNCSEDPVSYLHLRGSKPLSATEKKLFEKNVFLPNIPAKTCIL